MCEFMCVWLRVVAISDPFVQSELVTRDPDPIRICARYGPDTLAIRRLTHGMIHRSVLVCAMKTRWRFNSKIKLFHVSVCSCIISLFLVVNIIYILPISFHVTDWYIFSV